MDVTVWRALLALCIVLLLTGLVAGVWLLWRARMRPFTGRLVALALGVEMALALVWLASVEGNWPEWWDWFANANEEFSAGSLFSSAQLLTAGVTALVGAALLRGRERWGRGLLLICGCATLYLGLDETLEIHESLWLLDPEARGLGLHLWRALYVAGGGALALVIVAVWRQAYRQQGVVFGALLTGLAVTGLSGIAVEHVALQAWCGSTAEGAWVCDNPERWLIFEEIFEMVGITLVLGALLVFAQRQLEAGAWQRQKRAVLLAGGLAATGLVAYVWVLPTLELGWTATPLQIEWDKGRLVLQGIRVDGNPAAAGDEVSVWLYWQGRDTLARNLHVSLHALERPELAQSVASAEAVDLGQYRIEGWLPGVTVRKELRLKLPEELATPGSLALMLRVWRGNYALGEMRGIAVHRSEWQVLGEDQALIGSIALPGAAPDDALRQVVDARFGRALALRGYALPGRVTAGQSFVLALDWETLEAPGANHTQFVHLFSVAEERFAAGHDEAPFGARFPAVDWPAGHRLRDEWRVPLPAGLAPGAYRLRYGLYEPETQERLTLQVAGVAAADGLLALGTVEVVGKPGAGNTMTEEGEENAREGEAGEGL